MVRPGEGHPGAVSLSPYTVLQDAQEQGTVRSRATKCPPLCTCLEELGFQAGLASQQVVVSDGYPLAPIHRHPFLSLFHAGLSDDQERILPPFTYYRRQIETSHSCDLGRKRAIGFSAADPDVLCPFDSASMTLRSACCNSRYGGNRLDALGG